MIEKLEHDANENTLKWRSGKKTVEVSFACKIVFHLLKDETHLLVVELDKASSPDNALILNSDGTKHARIKNPVEGAICFKDGYYVNNDLTLIATLGHLDIAWVIDMEGRVERTYETR